MTCFLNIPRNGRLTQSADASLKSKAVFSTRVYSWEKKRDCESHLLKPRPPRWLVLRDRLAAPFPRFFCWLQICLLC